MTQKGERSVVTRNPYALSLFVIMHVLAGISIIVGFMATAFMDAQSAPQQTVEALWKIKYLLWAIFFELVALNCKT